MNYATLTLRELRALARSRGLPTWRSNGQRLRKADFLAMLDGAATGPGTDNTPSLAGLTVAELRRRAKRAGLPAWQAGGRRLRKRDLVAMLQHQNASDRRLQAETTEPAAAARPALDAAEQERLILLALAELPPCHAADVAMHRLLRGRDTQSDRNLLDGKRLDAIRCLRDAEPIGSRAWLAWHHRYLSEAAGLHATA